MHGPTLSRVGRRQIHLLLLSMERGARGGVRIQKSCVLFTPPPLQSAKGVDCVDTVAPLWRIMQCCHSWWGFSLVFSSVFFFSPHQPGASRYLRPDQLSPKRLEQKEGACWTSAHIKGRQRKTRGPASTAHRGGRWSAFLADEAVGNGGNSEEHRGKGGKRGAHGGMESRRDLPVGFRCGKCWLPVDSIRASSGSHVKDGVWGKERRSGKKRKE